MKKPLSILMLSVVAVFSVWLIVSGTLFSNSRSAIVNAGVPDTGQGQDSVTSRNLEATDGLTKEANERNDLLGQLALENAVFSWAVKCEGDCAEGSLFSDPAPEDFRQWFESDTTPQTWENYYYWLEIFYQGNFVSQGWVKTGREFVQESDHPQASRYVNVLGRVLASEWSKHNKVRRVGNMDMYRWGNALTSGKLSLEELAQTICDRLNESK